MKKFNSNKILRKVVLFMMLTLMFFSSNISFASENTLNNKSVKSFEISKDRKNYVKNGKKALYWHEIDNKWYYFGEDGDMVVGWQHIFPKFHIGLFEGDSIKEIGSIPKWYYFETDGALIEKGWKYLPIKHSTNTNKKFGEGIKEIGILSKWFYFDKEGSPLTGWINDNNSWFYLSPNENKYGEMQTGWIGNYYLKTGGYMAKSEWVFDDNYNSWFYLKEDGKYAENEWIGDYYLKTGGYMAKSEWVFDDNYNSWFYLKENGKYAKNEWIGSYYLNSNGYISK